ncbi:MAG TPA: ribonuclease HI [Cyclobacteriaceae bacterium]
MITMYTDGSSRGNPGPGGYGVILIYKGHRKELSAGYRLTTNNRMELMAVIAGLEALKKDGMEIVIYSDSKYVVDAIEKGWLTNWIKKGFKGKKNRDLWERYLSLAKNHNIKLQWIKGHNEQPENERCDEMAVNSSINENLKIDSGYEI